MKRPEIAALFKGENCPTKRPDVREKLRKAKLGKKRKPFSPEHIAHLKESRRKRKPHSRETINRIRASMRRHHVKRNLIAQ